MKFLRWLILSAALVLTSAVGVRAADLTFPVYGNPGTVQFDPTAIISIETLSAALDSLIGNTEGSMLYRGPTVWSALGAGTPGYLLQTQGTSAAPIWVPPPSGGGGSGCVTSGSPGNPLTADGSGGCTTNSLALLAGGSLTLGVQQSTVGSLTLANTAAGAFATTFRSSPAATAALTLTMPPAPPSGNNYQMVFTTAGVASFAPQNSGVTCTSCTFSPTTIPMTTSAGAMGDSPLSVAGGKVTASGVMAISTNLSVGTPSGPAPSAGDVDITGAFKVNGVPIGIGPLSVVTKTTNYSLTAGDNGTYFDNAGATVEVDYTLPAWSKGLWYCFTVDAVHKLAVVAPAGSQIADGTTNSATGGSLSSSAVFSTSCVYATSVNFQWAVNSRDGSWVVQ